MSGKIRTLICEHKYLQKITELCQHIDITSNIILISDLVNFTNAAVFNNFKENLPKILRNELYKIKFVDSTHEEQTNSEKTENLTLTEIKEKTLLLTERFDNNNMWLDLYKTEVASKGKVAHVEFYSMLSEIEEQKYSDAEKM